MKMPSFTLNKETLLITVTRLISYCVNAAIIAFILGLVAGGCYMLYLAITA